MENRWLKLHDFCSLWVLNSVVSYIFFVIFRTTTFFFPFISCLKVYLYLCSLIWFKVQTNWVMGRVILCLGIFVTETTSVRYEQDLSDSQFVFTICLFFVCFIFVLYQKSHYVEWHVSFQCVNWWLSCVDECLFCLWKDLTMRFLLTACSQHNEKFGGFLQIVCIGRTIWDVDFTRHVGINCLVFSF